MEVLVDLVPQSLINILKYYHAKFQKRIASFISFFIFLLFLFFIYIFYFYVYLFFYLIFHINFFINVIYTHIFSLFLHFVRQFPYGAMVLFKKKKLSTKNKNEKEYSMLPEPVK